MKKEFKIVLEEKTKTDYKVKITVEDWIKELLALNNNELTANLWLLQNKHPELLEKPADVYQLIIEVKNNPTMFFKNNRPDISLMAKRLENGYLGKIGIVNQGENAGKVAHATYSKRKNEFERLARLDYEENPMVGSPYPTLLSEDSAKTALGDKSLSSGMDIIPQDSQSIQKTTKLKKLIKIKSQEKGMTR